MRLLEKYHHPPYLLTASVLGDVRQNISQHAPVLYFTCGHVLALEWQRIKSKRRF